MKFQISKTNYDKPTPILFRRIGDGILALSAICSMIAGVFGESVKWMFVSNITGIIGKYISNFFSHKE